MRKGIAVSPGVAIGTAYLIEEIFVHPNSDQLEAEDIPKRNPEQAESISNAKALLAPIFVAV